MQQKHPFGGGCLWLGEGGPWLAEGPEPQKMLFGKAAEAALRLAKGCLRVAKASVRLAEEPWQGFQLVAELGLILEGKSPIAMARKVDIILGIQCPF